MKGYAAPITILLGISALILTGCPSAGPGPGTDLSQSGLIQGGVSYYVYVPGAREVAGTRQAGEVGQLTLADPGRPSGTARFMPRGRLRVLLRNTDQVVTQVEADNNGQFILPPLSADQEYDIEALPPVGREDEFAASTRTAVQVQAGQIVSAVSGSFLGAFNTQAQNFADFFPIDVDDWREYELLQGEDLQSIAEIGENVSSVDTVVGGRTVARFETFDLNGDLDTPIFTDFWWAGSGGLSYHGGEAPDYIFSDGNLLQITLDPPLAIPNGLVMGQAGTSTSEINAVFVQSRQQRNPSITIGYQLFSVGDTVEVPAGIFTDTLTVRYYFDMFEDDTLVGRTILDYVLARGVGVVRTEDFEIRIENGRESLVRGTRRQLIYAEVGGQIYGLTGETSPPVVEFYSHFDGEEIFTSRQLLFGGAYSLDVADPIEAQVSVNNVLADTVPVIDGSFSAEIALDPGENEIRVAATNENGTTQETITLILMSEGAPDVEVYLFWDAATDCDLYVAEPPPNGEVVLYQNPYGYVAELLEDNVQGFGPEIIQIASGYLQYLSGTYAVGANLYLGGPTNVEILVFDRGELVFDQIHSLTEQSLGAVWAPEDPPGSYWSALTLNVDAQGNVTVGPPPDPSAFWTGVAASRSSKGKPEATAGVRSRGRIGVRHIRPPTGHPGLRQSMR